MYKLEDFIDRLTSGPIFLFLGQDYLKLETNEDLFLSQIIRKYSPENGQPQNYYDIFTSQASLNPEEALSWMLNKCMHIPIPKPLDTISGYAWSGIFTSTFDGILARAFRSEWREVQQIFDDSFRPSEPRNRQKLHIHHLYGSVEAIDPSGFPPLREDELWNRQAMAVVLANRLPELITPLGTLVIEGYAKSDWFTPQEMFPVINNLSKGQAHIFSSTDEIENDSKMKNLINQGKLVAHRKSLAEILLYASETGSIKLGEQPEDISFAHQIRFNSIRHSIPPALWNQISSTAHILVESTFLPLPKLSKDKLYNDFRQFLFSPTWTGYAYGFAVQRNFEDKLRVEIYRRLESSKLRKKVVLLHGQTGTGKTIALRRLAYEIQKEGKYPVLFIERTAIKLKKEAIDRFCEWAEQNGALVTLIIWDGMQPPQEYKEYLQYLESRGRKVLLVGSYYKMENQIDAFVCEAPAELEEDEIQKFSDFINNFDPDLDKYIHQYILTRSGSFLVFLYRLLPHSRINIKKGINKEVLFAEGVIRDRTIDKKIEANVNTLLGDLLKQAGLNVSTPMLGEEPKDVGREMVTEFQQLIGLVMVPGQFNIDCPFELLMRSMNKYVSEEFLNILQSVDFFKWIEDTTGNQMIGPRSSLEAELIVKQRIGGAVYEIEYATKLLSAIRVDRLFENQEIQFAVDLIQNMGPNSRKLKYYEPHFIKLAQCLESIRETLGVQNPRLMLQESMLLREYAKTESDYSLASSWLKKSEKVALEALGKLEDTPRNQPFRSRMQAELASTYGQMATRSAARSDKLLYMQKAHEECDSVKSFL